MSLLTAICIVAGITAQATDSPQPQEITLMSHSLLKEGDLEGNMRLLNLGGEQSEQTQAFYKAAYEFLATAPNATFAEMMADAKIRNLRPRAILGGPMLGDIGSNGASVWVRTAYPSSQVEVEVTTDDGRKTFGPVSSSVESDLTAIVRVTGLKPEMRYPYRVLVDGKPIDMPEQATITTPPADSASKVRIAFGTCFHRWGLANQQQADLIRSRDPSAALFCGDIAVQDRNNHLGLHRADYLLRDMHAGWRNLVAAVPVYAIWDDHDYFDNDKAGIPNGYTLADKQGVCDTFQQAWNNPSYGFNDERRGIFHRTRIGPCDVIMLDTRYFRTGENGCFLGEEQMEWFERQLLDCQGPFIILASSTMWCDHVSNGKDSWGVWDPEGRERIFQLIERNKIGGVLLISGDRHGARGFRIPRPSGFNFYEFEAGSLGGRTGPPVSKPTWEDVQLYGIAGQYAFGEFTFDATIDDPEVTFRLIRDDGETLYERTFSHSELTPN